MSQPRILAGASGYSFNGHEALGIYSGEATIQFGGDAGVTITGKPGDVIGTGRRRSATLRASGCA